jgi:hypothetical protein
MKSLFFIAMALACAVGSTNSFARGSSGFPRESGFAYGSVPAYAQPLPQMPESRIPAPLPPPAQAPIINGPVSQPHGM